MGDVCWLFHIVLLVCLLYNESMANHSLGKTHETSCKAGKNTIMNEGWVVISLICNMFLKNAKIL